MTDFHEPLELSAPLARRLAPQLCQRDPATGSDCSWNHGFWQYLRLMGLNTTPEHQADFFRRAFDAVSSGDGSGHAPRVLVSGAADYSMLAHVLAAFHVRGLKPDVTVIDRCDTPLFLNRWYAERASAGIETRRCDILDYANSLPFDAVCTHSFLGLFAPDRRIELLAKWRELLRPGGLAITVMRVRDADPAKRIGFTAAEAQSFCAAVLRAAQDMRASLQVDPLDLARQAAIYASRQAVWPVGSSESMRKLFLDAGFSVDHLAVTRVAGGRASEVQGPTTPGAAEYAQIVARRL